MGIDNVKEERWLGKSVNQEHVRKIGRDVWGREFLKIGSMVECFERDSRKENVEDMAMVDNVKQEMGRIVGK